MSDLLRSENDDEEELVEKPDLSCSCVQDPFASLPPELRPRLELKKGGLRKVTCSVCGLEYWTNRNTDLCIKCEEQGMGKTR